MPIPFFKKLSTKHIVDRVTSFKNTPEVIELQALATAGLRAEYDRKIAEFGEKGLTFQSSGGVVYQTENRGEKVEVEVAVQVKGSCITWYFWAPGAMDQYPQAFRDQLYGAAAQCHKEVTNGCDLYYRGSNAIHVKLMHHHESESDNNHNHYRVKNNQPVTPTDFNQHLMAFKQHEKHDVFFIPGEVESLCDAFRVFHEDWTKKEGDQLSQEEQYMQDPSQKIGPADLRELRESGHQQEPCRVNATELKVDYETARRAIEASIENPTIDIQPQLDKLHQEYKELLEGRAKFSIRGLGSEKASTRQVEGSKNETNTVIIRMDDTVGSLAGIPAWAVQTREDIKTALLEADKAYVARTVDPTPPVPQEVAARSVRMTQEDRRKIQDMKKESKKDELPHPDSPTQ